MNILAIDHGESCGWAHSSGVSGVWDLSPGKDQSVGVKFLKLKRHLIETSARFGVGLVVFESVVSRAQFTGLKSLSQLDAILKLWCEENEVAFKGYTPGQIKKHCTGAGNAGKNLMGIYAQVKWPSLSFLSSDHCDAVVLCDLAMLEFLPNSAGFVPSEA